MNVTIENSWKKQLSDYLDSEHFRQTAEFVGEQYLSTKTIYPEPKNIFKALELCPFDQVKVVILGQDPYHGPDQAMGLSFSVLKKTTIPPSLKNIYKEIESDIGEPSTCLPSGDLSSWAEQGVLLLNSVLTVESGEPGSHAKKGWEEFTDEIVKKVSNKKENIVFLLWGSYAQKKGEQIDREKHLVLETSHPSPLGVYRGFNGCKHFSRCNEYLQNQNKKPIVW